jgi:hypothetical protein
MPVADEDPFYGLVRSLTRSRFLVMTKSWLRHCGERKLRGNPGIFKSVEYTLKKE